MATFLILTGVMYLLVKAVAGPTSAWEEALRRIAGRPAPVLAIEPAKVKPVRARRAKVAA